MIAFLAKIFIRENEDHARIRQAYGVLCGTVGILLNIFLFLVKFAAGTASKSIAITADAFNNFSDAGASIVTLIGFYFANIKADSEHPFGHGRLEYISGLAVSAAILLMAYELIRDSVVKILRPEDTEFSSMTVLILVASILIKLYMMLYNRKIGKKIDSAAMRATAADSLADACATAVVLAAALAGHFSGLHIDGYCGVLVGIFVLYAGISAAKETLDPLLGQPPEEQFVQQINRIVMSHPEVCGTHDLIVHDYGPGRKMISLHAEVPAGGDIREMHDVIDSVENELRAELGCDATIHMDPIITSDSHICELKENVSAIVREIDDVISMHDFRVVTCSTHTKLIFDVLVPFKFRFTDEELMQLIRERVKERIGDTYYAVMKIDKAYKTRKE